jgi:hypothetical protein
MAADTTDVERRLLTREYASSRTATAIRLAEFTP